MNYFAQLRALTSGIVLGGTLAIVCDMLGVSKLAVAALIGTFAFYVLMHDVRKIIANATGIQMTWLQTLALCTIGPATNAWLRFMCFMNGHTDLTVMIDAKHEAFGESFLRSLVVRCGRCHRVVRPATKDEAEAYMRERMSRIQIGISASFEGLAQALSGTRKAFEDFASVASSFGEPKRKPRDGPLPS